MSTQGRTSAPEPQYPAASATAAAALVGCPECDLLVRLVAPQPGQTARCPRCGYSLSTGVRDGFARPLAYALAALTLLAIALTWPFLSVDAVGIEHAITLASAVASLRDFGADGIALIFTAFVLLLPAAMMTGAATLTALLLARRPSPLLVPLARSLFHLDAWCMADVFIVGVIVSLVKLSTLAQVVVGTAFWAYLGFALSFLLALTNLDRLAVWAAIEELQVTP